MVAFRNFATINFVTSLYPFFSVFSPVPGHSVLAAQCTEIITSEFHFIYERRLTGEFFVMKTLKPNSSVMLIQINMLETHNRTRMKIIKVRNNNHHRQNNGNNINKNIELLKTKAAIWLNKMCRTKYLTPKYVYLHQS